MSRSWRPQITRVGHSTRCRWPASRGLCRYGIPADPRRGLAGADPNEDPRVFQARGHAQFDTRPLGSKNNSSRSLSRSSMNSSAMRRAGDVQPGSVDQHQPLDPLGPMDRQFNAQPRAEREADDRHAVELQRVQQVDIVPDQVLHVVDVFEPLAQGEARMGRHDRRANARRAARRAASTRSRRRRCAGTTAAGHCRRASVASCVRRRRETCSGRQPGSWICWRENGFAEAWKNQVLSSMAATR